MVGLRFGARLGCTLEGRCEGVSVEDLDVVNLRIVVVVHYHAVEVAIVSAPYVHTTTRVLEALGTRSLDLRLHFEYLKGRVFLDEVRVGGLLTTASGCCLVESEQRLFARGEALLLCK